MIEITVLNLADKHGAFQIKERTIYLTMKNYTPKFCSPHVIGTHNYLIIPVHSKARIQLLFQINLHMILK